MFSILGYLASELDKPISEIVNGGGVELAFISYPTAVATFGNGSQFFSAIFFLMLMALGLGSIIGIYSAIVGVVCDQFGSTYRSLVTFVVLSLAFLSSLVYVTPGGQHILHLVDFINADVITPSIVLMEIFVVSYIYGINNFTRDVNFMLSKEFGLSFKIMLSFIIPRTLTAFFIYFFINFPDLEYNDVPYPDYAIIAMWMLVIAAWIAVPITMIYSIMNSGTKGFLKRISDCCNPSEEWGPQDINEKRKWSKLLGISLE